MNGLKDGMTKEDKKECVVRLYREWNDAGKPGARRRARCLNEDIP